MSSFSGIQRSDSLDSIPSVDFLIEGLESEHDLLLKEPTISVFKRKEMDGEMQMEPLLTPDKSRFVLFPIKHTDVSTHTWTFANPLIPKHTLLIHIFLLCAFSLS